jgi:hypothetical protein
MEDSLLKTVLNAITSRGHEKLCQHGQVWLDVLEVILVHANLDDLKELVVVILVEPCVVSISQRQELVPSVLPLVFEHNIEELGLREEQVSLLLNKSFIPLDVIQLIWTVRGPLSLYARRTISSYAIGNCLIDVLILRDAFLQSLQSLSLKHILELVALFLVDNCRQTHIWVLIVLRVEPGYISEEFFMGRKFLIDEL